MTSCFLFFNTGNLIFNERLNDPFRTILNTLITAAFSGLSTMLMKTIFRLKEAIYEGPYDAQTLCNGVITGLVASAGGAVNMETWAAVVVGILAGIFYFLSSLMFDALKVDDPCHASHIYLIGGIWGILSMALLDQTQGVVYPSHSDNDRGTFLGY